MIDVCRRRPVGFLRNSAALKFLCQVRGCNFAIGDVAIDVFAGQMLAGFVEVDCPNDTALSQLAHDVIAFHVGIRIRGVRDLEGEPRQGDAGVFGARSHPVDACGVGRTVGVEPETGFADIGLGVGKAQSPESNVMPLTRTVIDCFLEANVLTTAKKIEGAERRCRIGRVGYECANHAQRACQAELIGLRPAGEYKGGAQLRQRARQHEIDGIAGQSIPGNCETRYAFTQENFKAHANDARQNNIGRYCVRDGQGQHGRQPAIGEFEDKNDEPDGEDAQSQDDCAAYQAFQQSHDRAPRQVIGVLSA